jgi:YidC/Oxa1 family membrane protein insertase
MFDRNTLIALAVVGVILLFLPKYYEWIAPPAPPPSEAVIDTVQTPSQPDVFAERPDLVETPATFDTKATSTDAIIADSEDPFVTAELNESLVVIETPLFDMTIGSNGLITRYELKEYTDMLGDGVKLHRRAAGRAPTVGFIDFDLGRQNAGTLTDMNFEPSTSRLFVPSGSDSVIFESGDPYGKYIRLVYVFDAKRYGFTISLATSGLTIPDNQEFNVRWMGGVPSTEPNPISDHTFDGAYAQMGDELEEIQLGSDEKEEFSATGTTHFVASRTKYFIAAIIPQVAGAGVDLTGSNAAPKDPQSPHIYNASLRQSWRQGGASGRWQVYWGPIRLENLRVYEVGLENTMNWGWAIIKPFSRLVLWMLTFMHGYIPNYGIVIILFSLIVKVTLWPLTRKSQISMKKMSALQPEIKALKEFHSKNPQAANKEMMALYKERGVNPAAGCIPILFQMPVLYGLFMVFRSTIEFRQAPFVGWISDLSQPDVIFNLGFTVPLYGSAVALLPIVMGISQFFMSKRTMTDPNQKAMIYIMPVFMTLIFNQFPSGLTLYYTLFNLLAIVEQRLIKIPDFTPAAKVVNGKDKKKSPPKTAPSAQPNEKKNGKKGKRGKK